MATINNKITARGDMAAGAVPLAILNRTQKAQAAANRTKQALPLRSELMAIHTPNEIFKFYYSDLRSVHHL